MNVGPTAHFLAHQCSIIPSNDACSAATGILKIGARVEQLLAHGGGPNPGNSRSSTSFLQGGYCARTQKNCYHDGTSALDRPITIWQS